MSYTLFISDLHLDPARPEHLDALKKLLAEHAGKADALYVLGDLFEAWIGDDDDTPFNLDAIAAFRQFSDSGSKLYFMHGNRDFMLGNDFATACGGTLLDEGTVVGDADNLACRRRRLREATADILPGVGGQLLES